MATTTSLQAEIASHADWFHCIDLGNGVVTPGSEGDRSRRKLELMRLPDDLTDRRVLDIGCGEGFFSFESERRGAHAVVAIDTRPAALAKFALCARALGSKAETLSLSVYDLDPATMGQFDVVFCLAVLHHLDHPLLAIERIAGVTRGCLVLEYVEAVPLLHEDAAMLVRRFGERGQFRLLPTRQLMLEMLARVGFARVEVLGAHRRKAPGPHAKMRGCEQQRVVVKCWKK